MKKKLLIFGLFVVMIFNAVACNNAPLSENSADVASDVNVVDEVAMEEEESLFSIDAKPIDGKEYEHNGFVYMMYDDGSVEITKYLGTDASVKIEEVNGYKVSRIGASAFEGCTTIEDIYLYADLISIGDCAFKGCTSLEDFKIPESMISIGKSAFEGCTAMTDVYLYADLTAIEDYTFKGCTSLEDFKLPESMINVGVSAFEGCTAMTDIYVYGGKTIGDYAFKGCSSLEDFKIPEGMTSIGISAFEGCISMTDVYVYSDDVTYGLNAFANCPRLEEMPEGAVNEYIRTDDSSGEDFNEETVTTDNSKALVEDGYFTFYPYEFAQRFEDAFSKISGYTFSTMAVTDDSKQFFDEDYLLFYEIEDCDNDYESVGMFSFSKGNDKSVPYCEEFTAKCAKGINVLIEDEDNVAPILVATVFATDPSLGYDEAFDLAEEVLVNAASYDSVSYNSINYSFLEGDEYYYIVIVAE